MKIKAPEDFIKVIAYEWEFVQKGLIKTVAHAKAALKNATDALEDHEQLGKTMGNGLQGREWRNGILPKHRQALPGFAPPKSMKH